MVLTPVQVRVLGCLIEKERTTPDSYPLTMNGLLLACNQATNRHPVVSYSEATVSNALENLRSANLLRIDYSRSNRAEKYRHVLDQALVADEAEMAVLGVLMVRGAQSSAELRTRTARLHPFDDADDVEAVLAALAARPEPLVVCLGRGAGQKEARWAHLLAGPVSADDVAVAAPSGVDGGGGRSRADRMETLEATIETLTQQLERLRTDHEALASRVGELLD